MIKHLIATGLIFLFLTTFATTGMQGAEVVNAQGEPETEEESVTEEERENLIDQLIDLIFRKGEDEIRNSRDAQETQKELDKLIEQDPSLQDLEAYQDWRESLLGPEDDPATGSTSFVEGDGEFLYDGELPQLDLADYGLDGYFDFSLTNTLLSQLLKNPKSVWATTRLLYYEKYLRSKGVPIEQYLTTGWLWLENGQRGYADVYSFNCNDNRVGYYSRVSFYCNHTNVQSSGFQVMDQRNRFVSMFNKCHGDGLSESEKNEKLREVMKQVIKNSDKALRTDWSYLDQSQAGQGLMKYIDEVDTATLDDISPNCDVKNSQKCQFMSLLLGSDPCMTVGLNSSAVSRSDLIANIKNGRECFYGSYCHAEKRLLASMLKALQLFDQSNQERIESTTSQSGGSDVKGNDRNQLSFGKYTHYCQCDPRWAVTRYWSFLRPPGNTNVTCNAGCGTTTLCAVLETLGKGCDSPKEMLLYAEKQGWWKNLMYTPNMINSGYLQKKGLKVSTVFADANGGGRSLTYAQAKPYFEGANKGKCLLYASSDTLNHIFYIRGVTDDGNILVVDSWKGCGQNKSGVPPPTHLHDVQPPSYADYYAYAICKK
ncbi:MAG: hypothetical protein ACOCXQ_02265 [Patescibacteria group bacterium]